jgi:hypothetical protein
MFLKDADGKKDRLSDKPSRYVRFLRAAFARLDRDGCWRQEWQLKRNFDAEGGEFNKSWPRMRPEFSRIEDGRLLLSVRGLARVGRASIFLAQFVKAFHIAVERYHGPDDAVLSVDDLRLHLGVSEVRARGLLAVFSAEGLLVMEEGDGTTGRLTSEFWRYAEAGDLEEYLELRRRRDCELHRGRVGQRLRRSWDGFVVPFWKQLVAALAVAAVGFAFTTLTGADPGQAPPPDRGSKKQKAIPGDAAEPEPRQAGSD